MPLRARLGRTDEARAARLANVPMSMNFGSPPDGQGRDYRGAPEERPFLMPAGMPPGTEYVHEERPPEGVYYFRIYGALASLGSAFCALFGLVMMFTPLFAPPRPGAPAGDEIATWIGGMFYGGIGTAVFIPWMLALFSGRKPWVHTLGTVLIALGMTSLCCMPIQIPLLIIWLKPETKRWFGAS